MLLFWRVQIIQKFFTVISKEIHLFHIVNMNAKTNNNRRKQCSSNVSLSVQKDSEDSAKQEFKVNLEEFKFKKKPVMTINNTQTEAIGKVIPKLNKTSRSQPKTRSMKHKSEPIEQSKEVIEPKEDKSTLEIIPEASIKEECENLEKNPIKREHIKVEYDTVSPKRKTEANESPKKHIKSEVTMPLNWEIILDNLREMRKDFNAPVDSMGCHKCHDEKASPKEKRYQKLISLMLSSQTKDQVTFAAMQRLIEHGCTVENILATTDEKLGQLIYPVGFWKSKVKYIKKTTAMLQNEYDCDIPKTAESLCKLSGVGPKMAHICMSTAWGEVTGIGVDTHVHRISNRLGWVKTKTPEETRKTLEAWLPHELWSEVNHLLVGFGQQTCQPVKPQCATCLNYELCPYGVQYIKSELKGKKMK